MQFAYFCFLHKATTEISPTLFVGSVRCVYGAGVGREVGPLNLAPTASTAVAMAIGDGLAAVWMQRRGISAQDFALNHPAGALGRQLTLTAADLMLPVQRWPPLAAMAPLPEVLAGLTAAGVGSAWVADPQPPGRPPGLIPDG